MSSEWVIRAKAVSKRYDIYERPHHRFIELMGGAARAREFWAVRGVDLAVRKGETVGIVGRNGSGKSTLLQLLCGTLEPTDGEVEVRGRIAALLELGAGFNPDFTGLENVYLNASLMGLSREETDLHLDGIIAFADIGDFLRQPVRTYSSGMYIRLAFAVAIAVEPDVLVIDEALAVGDEAFQRKCFSRIEELKGNGAAILFVSHSAGAVLQLCDRAVLMEGGRKLLEGAPKAVVGHYQRLIYAGDGKRQAILDEILAIPDGIAADAGDAPNLMEATPEIVANDVQAAERLDEGLVADSRLEYASNGARIIDPHLLSMDGRRVNVLASGSRYRYCYEVEFDADCGRVHFGMMIRSIAGIELAGMGSHAYGDGVTRIEAGSRVRVEFNLRVSLLPGTYFLNAGCMGIGEGGSETFLHRILDAVAFRIEVPRNQRRMSGFFDLAEDPVCKIVMVEGSR